MDLIVTLILAHLLADFPLQTNSIALNKSKSFQALLIHVFIYIATTWALLGFDRRQWLLVATLGLSHLFIDSIKIKGDPLSIRLFMIDQMAHLGFVYLIASHFSSAYNTFHSILPLDILYGSVFLATFLAVMVLFWLWANNLHDDTVRQYPSLRWGRTRLLELEQRTGFGLICFIGIRAMMLH